MTVYDVFNGDADGICSLIQLRLAQPEPQAKLITGVKRDIQLLQQVNTGAQDKVTVLDISMDKNRADLERIVASGASVFYADHHFAGTIQQAPNLTAHINTSADVCTAMIVNALLQDSHIKWAITGAFGDNLNVSARALAKRTDLSEHQIETLQTLGTLINYNGYGANLSDLHIAPGDLYLQLSQYQNPLHFCDNNDPTFLKLSQGYASDMAEVSSLAPLFQSDYCCIYLLPNKAWARRVSGIFSNDLANQAPDKAHAVVTLKANGNYLVSIRAPLHHKSGADEFCRRYPSGGGRTAAAGINDLQADALDQMLKDFDAFYRARLS